MHSNNNANILRKSRNSSIGENKEYFCSNYSRKELMQLSLSMKSTNEKMNEYLDSQLFSIVNDEEGYSCYKFLYMVSQMEDASFIMEKYKKYYIICKDIICDILNLLKEKIKTVPYYIKGLCKIIDLLAQKKFGDLKCYEKNIAISNLFLGILLKPFFLNLDFNTLINSWTVSAVVKKNLDTIYHIFKRIISGKLYMSSNPNEVYYTPFNGLTIDLMPEILSIFENLTDVQLPDIIMKLINGNISNESFLYDYFKENLEIGIKQNSFCITYDEIIRIIKIIKKFHPVFIQCEDKLNTSFSSMMTMSADNKSFNSETEKSDNHFAKLYERMTNDEILSYLQTKSAKEKGKKIKTFILFQKTLFNNHLDTLNNINMKNSVYTIKPIKDKEYSENEKNLIKTKNFICKILYYFQELKYSAFPFLKDLNTINILEALNPYLKSEYYILSADLPLDWYGNSLKSCIQLIPQEYIANDYSLLYNELINEISDAISIMKLSDLAEIDHSLNYIQRDINKTKIYIKHLKSLNIYNKIKSFIENAEIFVVIYNDINDKRFFSVEEKEKKSDFLKLFASKKEKEIKNIEEFITSFPEFNKLYKEKKIEVDYYEYINKFNVKPAIIDYYKIVEKYININEEFALVLKADKKNAESYIYSEVHKYIMNRIYDKLYIKYNKDEELNQTCISLKWVQAIHIISNPNIVLDNFLPNVTKLLQLVDKKKSPIEKFNILNNVAKLIQDTIVFSTGKTDNSIDDTTPFLLYALIHGNPANFYSNLRYIEEFLDDSMTMDNQGLILMQYTSTVELLLKFSYDKLYNISEEEYIANCEKCYQNHLDKI